MEYLILMTTFVVGGGALGTGILRVYRQKMLSFHLIFSVIYLITFIGGIPFSMLLAWQFDYSLPSTSQLLHTTMTILVGYLCYKLGYRLFYYDRPSPVPVLLPKQVKTETVLTAYLLLLVSVSSLICFIYLNGGFLLFRLEKYSQIFSPIVQGIPLKRFFYFFLPALIMLFFLKPSKTAWWVFLLGAGSFGLISYLAVGGTRANLALAGLFFILLGIQRGYFVKRGGKLIACVIFAGIIMMFALALWRYNLVLNGREAWHTFLYLTRDTFSPWENLTKILSSEMEFQGLMPIIRDFYVYIPQSLWAERPDIVWNTANYFTKIVLGNQSSLAISPTLLGSLYIMGGYGVVMVGMIGVGIVIALFDRAFFRFTTSPLIQTYCLANLFNFIVLVREGADAFVSRWAFFTLIFLGGYLLARQVVRMRCKNAK